MASVTREYISDLATLTRGITPEVFGTLLAFTSLLYQTLMKTLLPQKAQIFSWIGRYNLF